MRAGGLSTWGARAMVKFSYTHLLDVFWSQAPELLQQRCARLLPDLASAWGRIDVLEWAVARGFPLDGATEEAMDDASRHGHVDVRGRSVASADPVGPGVVEDAIGPLSALLGSRAAVGHAQGPGRSGASALTLLRSSLRYAGGLPPAYRSDSVASSTTRQCGQRPTCSSSGRGRASSRPKSSVRRTRPWPRGPCARARRRTRTASRTAVARRASKRVPRRATTPSRRSRPSRPRSTRSTSSIGGARRPTRSTTTRACCWMPHAWAALMRSSGGTTRASSCGVSDSTATMLIPQLPMVRHRLRDRGRG